MQSTWAASTNTWANTPYNWSNNSYPVTAAMTQVNLTNVLDEDTVFPRSLSYASNYGMSGTGALVISESATLSNTSTITNTHTAAIPVSAIVGASNNLVNNVNFTESIALGANSSVSGSSVFLWNDEAEDTATTWSATTDATDVWNSVTEDTNTTWTKSDE